MAKKSNSVTKSQRIDSLRKILSRWGRLNKAQIDVHLSAQLNLDSEAVSRTVYRDLDELVNNNEVRAEHFTRDGVLIEEFDPDIHKNTYCEWSLVGSESQIIGQDILKSNGALVLASDRLSQYLRVGAGDASVEFKTIHIFFNIPNHFLCLKISYEMLPVTLVIGRISSVNDNSQKLFQELELKYGKRTILLSLPVAGISSFKTEIEQWGHAKLNFSIQQQNSKESESIVITDLNSKNKTFFCKLSQLEADTIRKKKVAANQRTVSDGWLELTRTDLNIKKIQISGDARVQRPFLVFISEQVPILVL